MLVANHPHADTMSSCSATLAQHPSSPVPGIRGEDSPSADKRKWAGKLPPAGVHARAHWLVKPSLHDTILIT